MTNLRDLFDLELFEEMKGKGFVKVQRHPRFVNELAIANYTQRTQINYLWNDVTTQCRGLIYHPETLEVVARPFPKFYNHDESQAAKFKLDDHVFAFDKIDGSLGIVYPAPDRVWEVATRGSFTSDQAIFASNAFRAMLNQDADYAPFHGHTMLVEIVYPENRIVVDYGDYRGLIYLGEIENETGKFVWRPHEYPKWRHSGLKFHGKFRDLLKLPPEENTEGFVVHSGDDGDGRMVKVKHEEYVRLHRIVTRLSERSIWELMGGPTGDIEALVSQLPEEHAKWARDVAEGLRAKYLGMAIYVAELAQRHAKIQNDRKAVALAIANEPAWAKAAFFMGLDGKKFVSVLWKNVKPKADSEVTGEQKEEASEESV